MEEQEVTGAGGHTHGFAGRSRAALTTIGPTPPESWGANSFPPSAPIPAKHVAIQRSPLRHANQKEMPMKPYVILDSSPRKKTCRGVGSSL